MAELQTIFDGDDLGVMYGPGESGLLRVTFSCWGAPNPSWQRTIEGMGSIPALYVFGKRDHWYNTPELEPALEAIAPIREAHAKAMLMGSSMGAHAAIRLSKRLRADAVMAFSPQYCIQPELVGHSTRNGRNTCRASSGSTNRSRATRRRVGSTSFTTTCIRSTSTMPR